MKKVDLITLIFPAVILVFCVLNPEPLKVQSQPLQLTSSGFFAVCVTCAEPLCSSGQVLSTPKDPCLECPVCVDDCKCPSGTSFLNNECKKVNEMQACILLYDPVCGCDGKTYSNSCFANIEGVKKFTKGECSSSSSSSSSGSLIQRIALNKNFTGIWKGRTLKTMLPDKISEAITLQLCVKEGKLEGTIHQNGFIDNGVITSQDIISTDKVVVIVKDKNEKIETATLKLHSFIGRILSGTFSNGETFKARKVGKYSNCPPFICKNPCGQFCCYEGEICKRTTCAANAKRCFPDYLGCEQSTSSSSSSGGLSDCSPQGSCRGSNGIEELPCPEGTFCSGLPAYGCYPPGCPVPICLSPDTGIKTKNTEKRIFEIKEGEFVLTDGEKPVRVIKTNKIKVKNHKTLKITFNDGTILETSPNHPTADSRLFKDLKIGDIVDNRLVAEIRLVPYDYQYTYDILPDSPTGNYYANGILIGSTLKHK